MALVSKRCISELNVSEGTHTADIIFFLNNIQKMNGIPINEVIELMGKKNIDCRPFFYPLSSLPAYKKVVQEQQAHKMNPVSYEISPYGINLPSALNLKEEDVDYVCEVLNDALRTGKAS